MKTLVLDDRLDSPVGQSAAQGIDGEVGEIEISLMIHNCAADWREIGPRLDQRAQFGAAERSVVEIASLELRPGAVERAIVEPGAVGTDLQRIGMHADWPSILGLQDMARQDDLAIDWRDDGRMAVENPAHETGFDVENYEPGQARICEIGVASVESNIVDVAAGERDVPVPLCRSLSRCR